MLECLKGLREVVCCGGSVHTVAVVYSFGQQMASAGSAVGCGAVLLLDIIHPLVNVYDEASTFYGLSAVIVGRQFRFHVNLFDASTFHSVYISLFLIYPTPPPPTLPHTLTPTHASPSKCLQSLSTPVASMYECVSETKRDKVSNH